MNPIVLISIAAGAYYFWTKSKAKTKKSAIGSCPVDRAVSGAKVIVDENGVPTSIEVVDQDLVAATWAAALDTYAVKNFGDAIEGKKPIEAPTQAQAEAAVLAAMKSLWPGCKWDSLSMNTGIFPDIEGGSSRKTSMSDMAMAIRAIWALMRQAPVPPDIADQMPALGSGTLLP